VTALIGKRVEIEGQGGDQRFALAGFHLGNLTLVKNDAAHQLHIKMALSHSPPGCLTDGGEGFRQQLIQ